MNYQTASLKTIAEWIGMEYTYIQRLKSSIPKDSVINIKDIVEHVEAIIDSNDRVYRRVYNYLLSTPIDPLNVHTDTKKDLEGRSSYYRESFFDKVTSYWLGYNERPGDSEMYDLTAVGYTQINPNFTVDEEESA